MIESNSRLTGPSSTATGTPPATNALLSSDLVLCTAEAVPPSDIFCRIDELAPCLNFTQKDLAVALGVSAARVSQLIKIGMPLHSISAAKEWRIQQQRAVEETPELIESLVHKLPDVEQNDAHVLAAETESLASFVSQDQSELDSRATSHSMDSLVELVASKKPITREYLESLTTLHLRALCQPRGLRVRGFKNDLVCRLLSFFTSDARVSGNHDQLQVSSLGDLQRLCREQGLSTKGSKQEIVLRLMEPSSGSLDNQVRVSHGDSSQPFDQRPLPSSASSRSILKRSVASASVSKGSVEVMPATPVLSSETRVAAASNRAASSLSSSLSASSSRRISLTLTKSKLRPFSSDKPSSDFPDGDAHPHKKAMTAPPPATKSQPRPQYASLDLYFPVPSDAIVSVTAPILLDTYPAPLDTEYGPVTLIENMVPSPVRPFPSFVLPPPPRSYSKTLSNQRPPPGMGLSSCVTALLAHQQNATCECSRSSLHQVLSARTWTHNKHVQTVWHFCSRRQPRASSEVQAP